MTGTRFRHPAGGPDKTRRGNGRKPAAFTSLSRPGYGNICLCYLLTLTVFLSPLALVMAIHFADIGPHAFRAHYFYIRTSVGLLVIGAGLGCLMIVLGASFSTALIFAGLAFVVLTVGLTLARGVTGLSRALRCRPPRNYRSYFV